MSFKDLFIEHDRSAEEISWLEEEIAEQEARFRKLKLEMEELEPIRAQWYAEFFDRISTTGFNVDGDEKMVIQRDQLPVKPEGCEDQVVWKYGVDEEQGE